MSTLSQVKDFAIGQIRGVIQNDGYNNVGGGVNCRGNQLEYANGAGL
jgi:hypothetical protein